MNELKAYIAPTPDGTGLADYYLKSEADEVISTIRAERDEYRYNLSCARNEIHNMQALMRDDIKTIANLKADYKEACDCLQTANLIKDEQLAATRHHKYKRCLAMAKECVNGEIKLKRVKMRDMNNHQFWQFDNDYWQKWNTCWLKLAEKFKEVI